MPGGVGWSQGCKEKGTWQGALYLCFRLCKFSGSDRIRCHIGHPPLGYPPSTTFLADYSPDAKAGLRHRQDPPWLITVGGQGPGPHTSHRAHWKFTGEDFRPDSSNRSLGHSRPALPDWGRGSALSLARQIPTSDPGL